MYNYNYEPNKQFAQSFTTQLNKLMYDNKVRPKELAIAIDIQYNQMTGYLRGEHVPKLDILFRICKYFKVRVDTLFPVSECKMPLLVADDSQIAYGLDLQKLNTVSMTDETNPAVEAEQEQPRLKELSKSFSKRVVKMYQFLTEQSTPREFNLSKNLLLSGTNIGSTLLKTDYPVSRDEYFNNISNALNTARECQYWLDLLHETDFLTDEHYQSVNEDLKHITNILWVIIKKRKKVKTQSQQD